jgi:hypothetical protein
MGRPFSDSPPAEKVERSGQGIQSVSKLAHSIAAPTRGCQRILECGGSPPLLHSASSAPPSIGDHFPTPRTLRNITGRQAAGITVHRADVQDPRTASVRWRRSASRAGSDEPGGVRGIPGRRPIDGAIMGTGTPPAEPADVPPFVRDRGRAGLLAQAPRGVPCYPLIDRTEVSGQETLWIAVCAPLEGNSRLRDSVAESGEMSR